MVKLSEQSRSLLESVLQTLVDRYGSPCAEPVLTDFHFHASQETGDLTVTDDDGTRIGCVNVVEWCSSDSSDTTDDDAAEAFHHLVRTQLTDVLSRFNKEGALENLSVWKPYSFVLVDDDFETLCDLLLISDDTLIVTGQLLQGLDEELNDFLENLLKKDR